MRYLLIPLFILVLGFNYAPFANSTQCLPTCSAIDGRFLSVAGTALSTIAGAEIVVDLVSKGENLEFGIFDGEAAGLWDTFGGATIEIHLKLELHADPAGDASGLNSAVIALWTTDGSSGLNTGNAMPDNDWIDFAIPNTPAAQAANGDFVYTIRITPIDPMLGGLTNNQSGLRI